MKYSFVVSVNSFYLFALNCSINAAAFFGTNADFNILYDDDIFEEDRNKYSNIFPFEIKWTSLKELYGSMNIQAKIKPYRFYVAPWFLASQLLNEYDAICVLQADEFLITNVNNLFKIAAETDIVIATEYHGAFNFEDLLFGDNKSILMNNVGYALYDQLVFCGKVNKNIFIDTYKQQCSDSWLGCDLPSTQHPMTALNQACTTHLNQDKILGLDCHTWTWDRGAWTKYKLIYDGKKQRLYDREIRLRGLHTKWWSPTVVTTAIDREKEAGHYETAEIIAHNYNTQRDMMCYFNEIIPTTKNDNYTKEIFNGN